MAIQITTSEERIEPVTLLSKIKAKWISLVDRGAIAAPFQVTKEDNMAGKYIQAIILPDGTTLEDLSKLYEQEFKPTMTEKHDGLLKCILAPDTAFKSIEAVKSDRAPGVQFLAGELVDDARKEEMTPAPQLSAPIMDTPVAQEIVTIQHSFRDQLGRKAEAFMNAIFAAIELQTDPSVRKKQVLTAAQAFKDWLASAMDVTAGATKGAFDMTGLKNMINKIQPPGEAIKTDTSQEAITMDEKQIQELVMMTVTAALKADREAADTQAKLAAEKAEKDALKADLEATKAEIVALKEAQATKSDTKPVDKPDLVAALKADMDAMATAYNAVVQRIAGLENAAPNVPSPGDDSASKGDASVWGDSALGM